MTDKNEINVNISGGSNQNHFGQGDQTQNIYHNQSNFDIRELLTAMMKSTPEEKRPDLVPVLEELEKASDQKLPETEEQKQSLKDSILAQVSKLEPFVPYIRQTLAAFTEGALKTIPPPTSWIIGGCLEVCRQERDHD